MRKLNHTLFFVEGNPGFADCDAVVLGVAFDENATYGRGAAAAPAAIMRASHQLEIEQPLTGKTLQAGIHNFGVIKPKTAIGMIKQTEKFAKKALDAKKKLILLGGDHSIVNGLLDSVPKDATFVNFDGHLDLRQEWQGKKKSQQSHAAVSRRIFDKGFSQVWIGVRDSINEEETLFVSEQGLAGRIFYCPTMPLSFYRRPGFPQWMLRKNTLFNGLTKRVLKKIVASIESDNVFLNIDVDCLDFRQGVETGVPMPFGLTLEELNQAIFEICRKKHVVGMSLAELVPDRFNRGQTFAAMLCLNFLNWAMP